MDSLRYLSFDQVDLILTELTFELGFWGFGVLGFWGFGVLEF